MSTVYIESLDSNLTYKIDDKTKMWQSLVPNTRRTSDSRCRHHFKQTVYQSDHRVLCTEEQNRNPQNIYVASGVSVLPKYFNLQLQKGLHMGNQLRFGGQATFEIETGLSSDIRRELRQVPRFCGWMQNRLGILAKKKNTNSFVWYCMFWSLLWNAFHLLLW